jgi:hypothetical protein
MDKEEEQQIRQAMEASLEEQKLHEAMEASKEAEELRKAMQASLEEQKLHEAMEASLEEQKLHEAMQASKEANELCKAMQASLKDSPKKPIIPLKALKYINPSSLMESYALQEIGNDVRNIYIPPPDDSCLGTICAVVQLGVVTYAFVVENEDGSFSLVRMNEISHINGIVRAHEKPNIGDSVFWVKMDSGELAGGGTAFQFPHGTFWRSTPSGYRCTDSYGIEQSRLYLS